MPGDWRANTAPAAVPRASDPSAHSAVLAGIAPSTCACLPAYLLRPVKPLGVACSTSQSVVNESLPFPDWTALLLGHQPKCYLSGRCLLCYPSHRSIHLHTRRGRPAFLQADAGDGEVTATGVAARRAHTRRVGARAVRPRRMAQPAAALVRGSRARRCRSWRPSYLVEAACGPLGS